MTSSVVIDGSVIIQIVRLAVAKNFVVPEDIMPTIERFQQMTVCMSHTGQHYQRLPKPDMNYYDATLTCRGKVVWIISAHAKYLDLNARACVDGKALAEKDDLNNNIYNDKL